MINENDSYYSLWKLGFQTIQELETANGILASSRGEIYGCIFGRDSLITALKLIKAYQNTKNEYFLHLTKKILLNLTQLQGTQVNIESGEEPGKCIHEFRPDNHEHLTKSLNTPWYIYPDNIMRNYDSVDATPLLLIAAYRYFQVSHDQEFVDEVLPKINLALNWLLEYADTNNDGFIDYRFHPERKAGGLRTQNWMDSIESVFHEDGSEAVYPIAPVEVQAYSYMALKLWAKYFERAGNSIANVLSARAANLKTLFNEKFVIKNADRINFACGIDGNGKALLSLRSSIGHCLWASLNFRLDADLDCIVDHNYVPALVEKLFSAEMFEPEAGIRTLSKNSLKYDPNSYHNGSLWPHDNGLIAEGLDNFGYTVEAAKLRKAMLKAVEYFQTPIELFVYNQGTYADYSSETGQHACKKQAWSAASLLTETSVYDDVSDYTYHSDFGTAAAAA